MSGKPGWRLDWLVFACLLAIAASATAAFPDQPLAGIEPAIITPLTIPPLVENAIPGALSASPDDVPMATQPTALIWQGPALGAGPGGEEDAVEYGQARLLPTLGLPKVGPR